MPEKPQKIGYARTDTVFRNVRWQFEVLSEQPKIALAIAMTPDGPVEVALNRSQVAELLQSLELLLTDWPEGRAAS